MEQPHRVVIIGSGPAGLTAAIYTARAQLDPIVLVGETLGGQISWSYSVENYPGFPKETTGQELVERLKEQAEKFGAKLLYQSVQAVNFSKQPFQLKTDQETLLARTVIIGTGAYPRQLDVPGEKEFTGKGVSYCAICDGPFFKDKKVVVVGGGNSALDEGHFLTRYASKVTVIHRRDRFRADKVYLDQARQNPKMTFVLESAVTEIVGQDKVTGVKMKNLQTGQSQELKTDGVFIYIGQLPNTEIFRGQLELDEKGYLKIDDQWQTSVSGVFAAGECEDWRWRQMVTACGDGCKAALMAEKFLGGKDYG